MAKENPCLTCKVVKDPSDCERKQCKAWREWFIRRWEEMRGGRNEKPQTNADRIRAMSDEELAQRLYLFVGLEEQVLFCKNLPECNVLLDTEEGIAEERCVGCLLEWLRQPIKED